MRANSRECSKRLTRISHTATSNVDVLAFLTSHDRKGARVRCTFCARGFGLSGGLQRPFRFFICAGISAGDFQEALAALSQRKSTYAL